jgi:nicotinamide phosphoribosyltransferase
MKGLSQMILCDFYKISHRELYPKGTELVYSTWTPRASRLKNIDTVVAFGFQAFIKSYLMDMFDENFFKRNKEEVVAEYKRFIKFTLGVQDPDASHIEQLHDLGYLPLKIKAVPEGTLVPLRVPMLTIENTDPRFFWLTNYIETLASCELWQATTSATLALEYKKILTRYAVETGGPVDFVQFQGHDFSMRGMSSLNSAISSGMGHLLSFAGTDTCPAITATEAYYNANIETELIGTSVPATEHSIQCAYGNDMEYLRRTLSEVHPSGIVSIVSDGYDFWHVIGHIIPSLKAEILARKGGPVGDKVVIRPDSGDPVLIVTGDPNGKTELERKGAIEALWDIFGGTVNVKGFKELDPHIGLIYGDAITLERCEEICERLKAKGFASTNMVYGIGSYTYQYNTRDTFGFALKSTLVKINGDEKQIFKDPKTDNGTKKSQKGAVAVLSTDEGIVFVDHLTLKDDVPGNMLQTIFQDGKLLVDDNFSDIKKRLQ